MPKYKILYEYTMPMDGISRHVAGSYDLHDAYRIVENEERADLPRPLRIFFQGLYNERWDTGGVRGGPIALHLLTKLQEAETELARLREIERLAKEYRAKAMEFRTGDRLGWPESEAAFAAGKLHAASEALFAALGKEAAE